MTQGIGNFLEANRRAQEEEKRASDTLKTRRISIDLAIEVLLLAASTLFLLCALLLVQ